MKSLLLCGICFIHLGTVLLQFDGKFLKNYAKIVIAWVLFHTVFSKTVTLTKFWPTMDERACSKIFRESNSLVITLIWRKKYIFFCKNSYSYDLTFYHSISGKTFDIFFVLNTYLINWFHEVFLLFNLISVVTHFDLTFFYFSILVGLISRNFHHFQSNKRNI